MQNKYGKENNDVIILLHGGGFVLGVTDVYELSADAFDGTPVAGKKVTIEAGSQKHKVGV